MMRRWFRWWWLLFLIPILAGFARLHFDADVLDLLPEQIPVVQGLKIYQKHFTNSRQLLVTVQGTNSETTENAARAIAEKLRAETNLIADVTWQPPWLEHPEQTGELIAYLWLNQSPKIFDRLAGKLSDTNLPNVFAVTRDELQNTLSPDEIAQLSYDPLGLTQLPQNSAAPNFSQGQELFSSTNGAFRIIFVNARNNLVNYSQCIDWLNAVKQIVDSALATNANVKIGYTGRPAFVSETAAGMKHDIVFSVGGTSVIIAILFWLAHRRVKPMLWLLLLLALILAATLALGGLVFGSINVVSMGFAAILLGLAVDYAVVHYQEALAHPHLTIPEIRWMIAPAIFWAATTTISAFVVLNFGGLPGLAQLGSLVAIGVALAATVMIFAFLPPLFPNRMQKHSDVPISEQLHEIKNAELDPCRKNFILSLTIILIFCCAAILFSGLPQIDKTPAALQPRGSVAYETLNSINENLAQKKNPLWVVVAGRNENEVAQRLDAVDAALKNAVTNHLLSDFTLPTALWPRPQFQKANRVTAKKIISERAAIHSAAATNDFSENALGLTDSILGTWQRAVASTNVFWPGNPLTRWIFEKLIARDQRDFFAVGFLYPENGKMDAPSFSKLESQLPHDDVWLSSWDLLGGAVLAVVKKNFWKLLAPMVCLVLLSLWLAFRHFKEILLGIGVLILSGFCLLSVMKIFGATWNLFNLMAAPLILGTGVDYSIFMQLALRRHGGNLRDAHYSVGRALLLCGGTAIAGFGSLGLSSNAGMASLGRTCAVGIACNMLFAVFLLPVWWKIFSRDKIKNA